MIYKQNRTMAENQTSLEQLQGLLAQKSSNASRLIVAIAGPPGAGKSTFVGELEARLNATKYKALPQEQAQNQPQMCAILAMDGYHYDDIYLNKKGWRDRKGAPHTFDVGGLASILGRLRHNNEPGIAVPVFDRKIEIARAGAQVIDQSARIILLEGNYLLLDQAPWRNLAGFFDLTIMLEVPRKILEARLRQRWGGSSLSFEEIERKVRDNDMKNVDLVLDKSLPANYYVLTNSV